MTFKSVLNDTFGVAIECLLCYNTSVQRETLIERRHCMDAIKLREAMHERGITVLKMCDHLGISRKAFWSKCTGKSEFKQSEIVKICELLGMKDGTEIFFPKSVL